MYTRKIELEKRRIEELDKQMEIAQEDLGAAPEDGRRQRVARE